MTRLLIERTLRSKRGPAVDATLMAVPQLSRHKDDPCATGLPVRKKGPQMGFSMKGHLGANASRATSANATVSINQCVLSVLF